MKAAITITVIVPTSTPTTVRKDRNLWSFNVERAIQRLSRRSCLFIQLQPPRASFSPQSHDRIQFGCLPGRVYSKKQANARRNHQRKHSPEDRKRRWQGQQSTAKLGQAISETHTDRPTEERQHSRFRQKLLEDVAPARPQGLPYTNLLS